VEGRLERRLQQKGEGEGGLQRGRIFCDARGRMKAMRYYPIKHKRKSVWKKGAVRGEGRARKEETVCAGKGGG
jgi:hypothetical protein